MDDWYKEGTGSVSSPSTDSHSSKFINHRDNIVHDERGEACYGLVIEGHAFSIIQEDPNLQRVFIDISSKSQGIIICRASPS